MLAKEIMTMDPITVSPDATVEEIAQTMVGRRVSAVPVVDNGTIVGIVSEGDLMRRPETDTEPHHSWWLRAFASRQELSEDYVKSHGHTAAQVMTGDVITVTPDTPAGEIADILSRRHVKRVPVVDDDGKLVGIVSRADIVRGLAAHKKQVQSGASTDDVTLRETIMHRLMEEGLRGEEAINPIVSGGTVSLWGWVETEKERQAVELAVAGTYGVRSVENKLGILAPSTRSVYYAE